MADLTVGCLDGQGNARHRQKRVEVGARGQNDGFGLDAASIFGGNHHAIDTHGDVSDGKSGMALGPCGQMRQKSRRPDGPAKGIEDAGAVLIHTLWQIIRLRRSQKVPRPELIAEDLMPCGYAVRRIKGQNAGSKTGPGGVRQAGHK